MPKIRIQFDANQPHQNDAVASVVDLFAGLFRDDSTDWSLGDEIAPNLAPYIQFDPVWLLDNLQAVQRRNKCTESLSIETESGYMVEGVSVDTAEYPVFTIDMETGTGKTYVYLKTIHELYRKYQLRKFIVVVPSIAIFEGVIKTFDITREHFKAQYNNEHANLRRYDGSRPSLIKNFALGKDIEILVMTIDSFNKKANTIFKNTDKLMGGKRPIDYLQETRPILILDESQNYTSDKARAALRTLKPLFALNYSATPGKTGVNKLYNLSPFDAFQRNLVKKIEVLGVTSAQATAQAADYLQLTDIRKRGAAPVALFALMVNTKGSLEEKEVEVTGRSNLKTLTHNEAYDGWVVEEINLAEEFVAFKNGERFNLSEERSASVSREALFRKQIEETIKAHFAKQWELRAYGVKVLSLFFIDRVANYVPDDGIIKRIFDETFDKLKKNESDFSKFKASDVREGYFAKKRIPKKTEEVFIDTPIEDDEKKEDDKAAEQAAYDLIMKNKEKLLSFTESAVSFIFAHSALREGWDNPNVFQICVLREISSEKQRRQTIGRGLRLPVDQHGERLFDRRLNTLTVVANESYARYVDQLQKEYAASGDVLPALPADASKKETAHRNERIFTSRDFKNFWNKLVTKTEYEINLEADSFIAQVTQKLNLHQFPAPHVIISKGDYVITNYRIQLIDVQRKEATIEITREDSLGQKDTHRILCKTSDDLAKKLSNPVYNGFKIVDVDGAGGEGRVHFSDRGELSRDHFIQFSSEQGQTISSRKEAVEIKYAPKFNLIERAARELSLTRATILRIFKGLSPKAKHAYLNNPEGFAGSFVMIIKEELSEHIADRISYQLTEETLPHDIEQMFPPKKEFPAKELKAGREASSLYDLVQHDSENEMHFIERLNDDNEVLLYFKFPATFKIRIPKIIGNYNPDWGILRWNDEHRLKLELVRETKGNIDLSLLQYTNEKRKIKCARQHFERLGISYRHITSDTMNWWQEEIR